MQITSDCIACDQCREVCPNDAIDIKPSKGYSQNVINRDKCCNCGKCVEVCPNEAIEE